MGLHKHLTAACGLLMCVGLVGARGSDVQGVPLGC